MKKLLAMAVAVFVVSMATTAWAGAEKITSLPFTINDSGSYRLDSNLSSSGAGIIVDADNVTIDFEGYTITGQSNPDRMAQHNGVMLNGHVNVEIKNGTIVNFTDGIYGGGPSSPSSTATLARVIDMRILNNAGDGIALHGENHVVRDCTIAGNSRDGIHLQNGAIVTGSVVANNGSDGIGSHGYTVVSGNLAIGNADDGIDVSQGATITGNVVGLNSLSGIEVRAGSTLQDNVTYNNVGEGIRVINDAPFAAAGNASAANEPNMTECVSCDLGVNSIQ